MSYKVHSSLLSLYTELTRRVPFRISPIIDLFLVLQARARVCIVCDIMRPITFISIKRRHPHCSRVLPCRISTLKKLSEVGFEPVQAKLSLRKPDVLTPRPRRSLISDCSNMFTIELWATWRFFGGKITIWRLYIEFEPPHIGYDLKYISAFLHGIIYLLQHIINTTICYST